MLASIEAQMRRLGKLAHQTARQVTALKTSVEDGHQMVARETDYLAMRSSSPVMTKTEQSLPEWKFFNKESNSIFRNIRVVERWLQGMAYIILVQWCQPFCRKEKGLVSLASRLVQ